MKCAPGPRCGAAAPRGGVRGQRPARAAMGTRWGSGPTGAPSKGARGASAIALTTDPRGEPFFLDDAPVRRGLAMSAAAPAPCLACISRHHGQHSCSRRRSFATPSPVEQRLRYNILTLPSVSATLSA